MYYTKIVNDIIVIFDKIDIFDDFGQVFVGKFMSENKILTPMQVAELLGVSPITVRNWSQKNLLASLTTPGGHRRYRFEDIKAFATENGLSVLLEAEKPLRILVVEDDQQFAGFLKEALGTILPDAETAFAYDGFEAGRQVQRFKPDIILLDLMLPGIDGFKICNRLYKDPETRHIKVFAMTGYDSPENVTRILDAGARACLSKPFTLKELKETIFSENLLAENQVAKPRTSLG